MKISILGHDLSSNAAMRAHRLAAMAEWFADVEILGPVDDRDGLWPALPRDPRIRVVRKARFPSFFDSLRELAESADGDVIIAVKPHLASLGAAFLASSLRPRPVVLDLDDLDGALAPRALWREQPEMADMARPDSAVYVSLLERAAPGAEARTASSSILAGRFDATLLLHGAFEVDPSRYSRDEARMRFNLPITAPVVLFVGASRQREGIEALVRAARRCGALVALPVREGHHLDLVAPPIVRMPVVRLRELPWLLAAADVVAIPSLDVEAARMPMNLYDAMAMGIPIVATDVSDVAATLGGAGIILPPGDEEALTSALGALTRDRTRAAALGRAARERFLEHFTIERLSGVLHTVVEAAIQTHAARG